MQIEDITMARPTVLALMGWLLSIADAVKTEGTLPSSSGLFIPVRNAEGTSLRTVTTSVSLFLITRYPPI
jgi:hypothetical protein